MVNILLIPLSVNKKFWCFLFHTKLRTPLVYINLEALRQYSDKLIYTRGVLGIMLN